MKPVKRLNTNYNTKQKSNQYDDNMMKIAVLNQQSEELKQEIKKSSQEFEQLKRVALEHNIQIPPEISETSTSQVQTNNVQQRNR